MMEHPCSLYIQRLSLSTEPLSRRALKRELLVAGRGGDGLDRDPTLLREADNDAPGAVLSGLR